MPIADFRRCCTSWKSSSSSSLPTSSSSSCLLSLLSPFAFALRNVGVAFPLIISSAVTPSFVLAVRSHFLHQERLDDRRCVPHIGVLRRSMQRRAPANVCGVDFNAFLRRIVSTTAMEPDPAAPCRIVSFVPCFVPGRHGRARASSKSKTSIFVPCSSTFFVVSSSCSNAPELATSSLARRRPVRFVPVQLFTSAVLTRSKNSFLEGDVGLQCRQQLVLITMTCRFVKLATTAKFRWDIFGIGRHGHRDYWSLSEMRHSRCRRRRK